LVESILRNDRGGSRKRSRAGSHARRVTE
jgi:hypothetical protein